MFSSSGSQSLLPSMSMVRINFQLNFDEIRVFIHQFEEKFGNFYLVVMILTVPLMSGNYYVIKEGR